MACSISGSRSEVEQPMSTACLIIAYICLMSAILSYVNFKFIKELCKSLSFTILEAKANDGHTGGDRVVTSAIDGKLTVLEGRRVLMLLKSVSKAETLLCDAQCNLRSATS